MPHIQAKERDYVRWQNRAVRFYLAARLLYTKSQWSPAAYCANQALELLMKATLIYWDRSFKPQDAKHSFAKLTKIIQNKVPNAKSFACPSYFSAGRRYLSVTRYPTKGGDGVAIPHSFLPDLDACFAELILLVPFQHNTALKRALSGGNRNDLNILRQENRELRRLRRRLGVKLRA